MKKLQQFYMFKFDTDRLRTAKFNININLSKARLNGEVIAAGDNQVFRTIRKLCNKEISYEKIDAMFLERRTIKRKKSTPENISRLIKLNEEIDDSLFVPQCIAIICNKTRDYKKINRDGFIVNDKKFVRLLCSAGNARRNTSIFVNEEIEKELKKILNCGKMNIPLVDAKYNAYFALAMSATYPVSDARLAVVDDCITHREELVDWITETDGEDIVETCIKNLEFNLFDGMGVCSVEQARRWADDLDVDYIPSAFCIRNAFLKGMVATFDIQRFAKKIAKKYSFTDLYGNEVDIRNVDVIVSKSQLKLWNAYDSCEDYLNKTAEYGFTFGISKFSPKEDKTSATLNYQFIQATNQTKESIEGICEPTINWFNNLLGGSKDYLKLYVFGRACDNQEIDIKKVYDDSDDVIAKAILLNDNLIDDPYIKQDIYHSINRKIKDSYIGKLIVDGNFQTMLVDPYAFMEHVFGMNVVGLLGRDEYFSDFWNRRDVNKVAAMRAPLTWRSEVNVLSLLNKKDVEEWFKYLTSGIVLNVHGNDFMKFADGDADGDLLMTTNQKEIAENSFGGVPITYEKKSAKKNLIEDAKLYNSDLLSFNPKIGFITNTSSTMYVLLDKILEEYGVDSEEYKMLMNRLKICRKAQGDTIDSAKGIVVKDFPKWWTSYVKITDDMTKEQIQFFNVSNHIVITSEVRPYFFRYLYSDYNSKYSNRTDCYDEMSVRMFGSKFCELVENDSCGEKEDVLISAYERNFGFIDNGATMNLLCHFMEDGIKRIKQKSFTIKDNISSILTSNKIRIDEEKMKEMQRLYHEFVEEKRNFLRKKSSEYNFSEKYKNLTQVYKEIRRKSIKISSSDQELTNLAVELCYFRNKNYDKSFVWKIFSDGILLNVEENRSDNILFPIISTNGNIEYLGKKYENREVDIYDV